MQLGEVAAVTQGGRLGLTKEADYAPIGVPAFSAAGCDGFVGLTEHFATDAVVLSAIGANCGRCFFASGDWTSLANVQLIIPHTKLDAKFFYYRASLPGYWERSGSAQPFIKPSSIGRSWIAFPENQTEQRRIAAILTSLDYVIEATEALIEKQQQIKAGLMHDLLTRGVLDGGTPRPSSLEAPHDYVKTKIGSVPAGWEVTGLQAKQRSAEKWIRTGPFGTALKSEHWVIEGHPVITIGSLGEGEFNEHELLFVSQRDASRLAEFQLKLGDVVFSRVADVGRSVVVREENVGWIMSSNLMRIAVDAAQVRPDFLQMLLAGDTRIKSQIRAKVNSGGREVANSEILGQLLFAWPPIEEQDRIIARLRTTEAPARLSRACLRGLRMLKQGLMQDLLTGKVRVPVPNAEAIA